MENGLSGFRRGRYEELTALDFNILVSHYELLVSLNRENIEGYLCRCFLGGGGSGGATI